MGSFSVYGEAYFMVSCLVECKIIENSQHVVMSNLGHMFLWFTARRLPHMRRKLFTGLALRRVLQKELRG